MKAIRIRDGIPVAGDEPAPTGAGVLVDVRAASICGSDLEMISHGFAEGRILGHEIAGFAPDGTAVAVEPIASCRACVECLAGHRGRCLEGPQLIGVAVDGGMAEQVMVPADALVPLPAGLDVATATLVEPLAVALHALARARLSPDDRVLVIGAGAIGLASVAVLSALNLACDVSARHPHQAAAADRLGGRTQVVDGYDVVVDSIGTAAAIGEALARGRPGVRIVEVGLFWEPVPLDLFACMKEVELITAAMYGGLPPDREMDTAARILRAEPAIADTLITHRFPLDAAPEGFAAAGDRASGSIKVVFEP